MNKIAQTGTQAVNYMLEEYLEKRSVAGTQYWLTDDIQWIGTGANEEAYGKNALEKILILDMKTFPNPFKIASFTSKELSVGEGLSSVFAKLRVVDSANSMAIRAMRISFCCRMECSCYKICAMHASVANAFQYEDEYFPVYFSNEKIKKLNNKHAHANELLVKSEEMLRRIINNIPGGIVEFKASGDKLVPTYLSDGWCTMMDDTRESLMRLYKEDAMIGVHPDDFERVNGEIRQAMEQLSPINSTYRIRNAKGDYHWVNNRGTFVRNSDGIVTYSAVYTDVTAGMDAQKKQKKSEEKLMAAMNHVNVMYWEYRFKDDVCINGFKSIRDLEMPEYMPNYPECVIQSGFIHPDSAEAYRLAHMQLKSGIPSIELDVQVVESNGEVEWKRIKYTTICDESGKPASALGTSEDITQQRNAEERYQQAERYRQALGASAECSFRLNLTQNICSDGHIKNYTIPDLEEIKTVDALFDYIFSHYIGEESLPEMQSKFGRQNLLQAFDNGKSSVSCEHRYKSQNGEVFWFRTTADITKRPENNDIEAIIYAVDISEHKNAETLIHGVVANNFDFITQLNAKTGSYSMYIQNKEHLNLPALVGEDYYERNVDFIKQYVMDDEIERCLEESKIEYMVARLEREGDYYTYYKSRNPDGTVGQKKLHIFYSDRAYQTICIARTDITKDLQEQQRKNDMLKNAIALADRANQAKTAFLSRMSHEIRTPMNAIIGMSALAAQCVNEPEQIAECLSKIGISARFLLSLINDILDMSRIESGKVILKKEEIIFEEFIHNINAIAHELADSKQLDYDCIITSFTEDVYLGDAMKLQQVLVNIISNAIKFTPPGGKVQFIVQQTTGKRGKAHMHFTINDTGIGISEEFLPHLFEPFEQANNGITTPYGGTGLGLAICKNLVDMMDGTIGVNSIVGIGTEFTVDLDLDVLEEKRKLSALKTQIQWEKLYALVVDDEIAICQHTQQILESMGTKAEWVDGGVKAVARVKEKWDKHEAYNLILLDWKMPELDGIETARQIRSIVGADVTIIIMTAYDWAGIEVEAKLAGVNLLISKPLFQSSICSAFEKIYSQKENEVPRQVEKEYDFTGKTVLLVEDHLLNIEVAKRLLSAKGVKVEVAENGLRAIEMFTLAPVGYYDLILMDIRMPVMDGLTATKSIRQLQKQNAKTIPIVAMSANAFEEDVEKSKVAGMNYHLAKPIEPQTLYDTLDAMWLKS